MLLTFKSVVRFLHNILILESVCMLLTFMSVVRFLHNIQVKKSVVCCQLLEHFIIKR